MKYLLIGLIIFFRLSSQAQIQNPKIEPCKCQFLADSSLKTKCGYLIVPENRANQQSQSIKLSYIYVESSNPNKKKDPVLFITGGSQAEVL